MLLLCCSLLLNLSQIKSKPRLIAPILAAACKWVACRQAWHFPRQAGWIRGLALAPSLSLNPTVEKFDNYLVAALPGNGHSAMENDCHFSQLSAGHIQNIDTKYLGPSVSHHGSREREVRQSESRRTTTGGGKYDDRCLFMPPPRQVPSLTGLAGFETILLIAM